MAFQSPNLSVIIRAIEKASKSLIRDFGEVERLQVSQKGPGNFVSAADHRAEDILFQDLKKSRPSFGFLMEEQGEVKGEDGEHRYIIDPLDGTNNFLHGVPHWSISVALEKNGELICGAIYDPIRHEMFTAEKGMGALMNNRRLRVSARKDARQALIAGGDPCRDHTRIPEFMGQIEGLIKAGSSFRRQGSAALDLCYVAAGRLEAFWERDLGAWDIAAGALIVKEAGGQITSLQGDPNPVYAQQFLASNGLLHTIYKDILTKHIG